LQWRAIGTGGATVSGGNLTLEPLSSTVGTSTTTTLVARLSDAAGVLPLFNTQVDFNVVSGPNAGQTAHVVTDPDGVAIFSYTGTVTGTDTVVASVTNINNGIFYSNPAAVIWAAPPPASAGSLTLDPTDSVTATINGSQTFTVTALDGSGNPVPHLAVMLAITGVNATTLSATTNARGQAMFAYRGRTTGLDGVQALASAADGSALFSGVATVRWGLPPGSLAINAGGVAGGFDADTDYIGGWYFFASSTHRIDTSGVATNNPAPRAVYQTARCGNFSYTFPHLTPGAPYTVRLHFSERDDNGPSQRLFGVAINATQALTDFDVFATGRGQNRAVVEQFAAQADVSGTIGVTATTQSNTYAFLNGLEIVPPPAPGPSLTLSPGGAITNTIYHQQAITATARDGAGQPLANLPVALTVRGPNAPNDRVLHGVTDSQGRALYLHRDQLGDGRGACHHRVPAGSRGLPDLGYPGRALGPDARLRGHQRRRPDRGRLRGRLRRRRREPLLLRLRCRHLQRDQPGPDAGLPDHPLRRQLQLRRAGPDAERALHGATALRRPRLRLAWPAPLQCVHQRDTSAHQLRRRGRGRRPEPRRGRAVCRTGRRQRADHSHLQCGAQRRLRQRPRAHPRLVHQRPHTHADGHAHQHAPGDGYAHADQHADQHAHAHAHQHAGQPDGHEHGHGQPSGDRPGQHQLARAGQHRRRPPGQRARARHRHRRRPGRPTPPPEIA